MPPEFGGKWEVVLQLCQHVYVRATYSVKRKEKSINIKFAHISIYVSIFSSVVTNEDDYGRATYLCGTLSKLR